MRGTFGNAIMYVAEEEMVFYMASRVTTKEPQSTQAFFFPSKLKAH